MGNKYKWTVSHWYTWSLFNIWGSCCPSLLIIASFHHFENAYAKTIYTHVYHTRVKKITIYSSLYIEETTITMPVPVPSQVEFGYKSLLFGPLMDVINGLSIGSWQSCFGERQSSWLPHEIPKQVFYSNCPKKHPLAWFRLCDLFLTKRIQSYHV